MAFTGLTTALVTPFRNGAPDLPSLERHVERQIAAGVQGLMALGTTGEGIALTIKERETIATNVISTVGGRVPVMIGCGSASTRTTIEQVQQAADLGAQAALVVVPYYNKPSQEGLRRHFTAIADAARIPLVLYNVPGRTVASLAPETVFDLSHHPSIMGLKDSSGAMSPISQMLRQLRNSTFKILNGVDALTLPLMALGAHGVVSVLGNLLPGPLKALVSALQRGSMEEARKRHDALFPLMEAIFWESNPMPIKALLHFEGLMQPDCRSPLCEVRPETLKRLQQVWDEWKRHEHAEERVCVESR